MDLEEDPEKKDEFTAQHTQNQESYDDWEEALNYYKRLYDEVFKSTENQNDEASTQRSRTNPDEKLKEAYRTLSEAAERGARVDSYEFKLIRRQESKYDEKGCNYDASDLSRHFFLAQDGELRDDPFDVIIRYPVFQALKYKFSFSSMIMSEYFIGEQ